MAKKQDKKQCFVVGPIGDDDSEDRIHADWLLEEIIQPVFRENYPDFEVTRADKVSNPGLITSQVIAALLEADLVIADLTTLNPNAFYEVGIRHVLQKPIIHMHLEGQRIPFDVAPFRSIKFSRRRPSDIRAARENLLLFLKEALDSEHVVENPVTYGRGKVEFDKSAAPAERIMGEEIAQLRWRLGILEGRVGSHEKGGLAALYGNLPNPFLMLEIGVGPNGSIEHLIEFLKNGYLVPNSARLLEKNNNNFVYKISDTSENRDLINKIDSMAVVTNGQIYVNSWVP